LDRISPRPRKTGETEPFPYGDDRFGAQLRDDLTFLLLEKDLLYQRLCWLTHGGIPESRQG
jgi:hypothetical protein